MKILDLFSGIGGFSLGLERAGMTTIAFCEKEPFCQTILKRHWPDVPVFDDIRSLSADDLPEKPDLVCGGYPCQPFSVAGQQRGAEDDRHLWPEMLRIIQECRPTWVIAENVAGHIRLGLDQVLSDLEAEGYFAQPFVIPACAVDAPHRRDRLWIVGYAKHDGSSATPLRSEPQQDGPGASQGAESSLQSARTGRSRHNGALADTESQRTQGLRAGGQQEPYPHGQQGLSVCQGQRSESTDWQTEPAVGRVADGIPGRVDRIRALGNAVVPQIPELIGRVIMNIEKG